MSVDLPSPVWPNFVGYYKDSRGERGLTDYHHVELESAFQEFMLYLTGYSYWLSAVESFTVISTVIVYRQHYSQSKPTYDCAVISSLGEGIATAAMTRRSFDLVEDFSKVARRKERGGVYEKPQVVYDWKVERCKEGGGSIGSNLNKLSGVAFQILIRALNIGIK